MSTRAERLLDEATQQIDTLSASLASAGEAALARPCPGRGKLGDGTVGAVALHTIDNYRRVARFIEAAPNAAARGPHDAGYRAPDVALGDLLDRLQAAKRALAVLAALDDAALDAVAPAGDMRFADGQRTLEQILASILKHQRHAVDALAAALG